MPAREDLPDPGAVPVTDDLNNILIECAKLRGCYPLMHRTLQEFRWFCSAVIFGASPVLGYEIQQAEVRGDPCHVEALTARQSREMAIYARFHAHYRCGDGELLLLAEAFAVYCHEVYGGD